MNTSNSPQQDTPQKGKRGGGRKVASFLNIIAADMLGQFSADMRDVAVCFPGKRAGMFLSRELALLSDKPVWAPRYLTMDDLFLSLSPLEVAEPMECICLLHGIMQEVLGSDYTETLDEFWSWGEVLMADFNDIDKHMADARAIFTDIADRERLRNNDFLDEHQRETLIRFFGRFSLDNTTRLQERFLKTWSHMYDIYSRLREQLLAKGKLWEGALYRDVAERMLRDDSLVAERITKRRRAICFAGFNVLNDVEHTMMKCIQREGKARFYWDYDVFYAGPKSDHEAGFFMKQNLRDFPSAITSPEVFNNLSRLSDVTFIACTSDNAAARFVNTYISEELQKKNGQMQDSVAVVLANEKLMQPVLHAIPDGQQDVNVTMGFPLADTPVYGILQALLKMQIEGYDSDRKRFRYPFEQMLRRQPFFEFLNEEECFEYQEGDTQRLINYLLKAVRQIALHFAQIEEPDVFEQLYIEALFRTDKMLCQLKEFVDNPLRTNCEELNVKNQSNNPSLEESDSTSSCFTLDSSPAGNIFSPATLRRLLRQAMTSTKIPFHSQPDRGLQVMGVLETRLLDFNNLLLLSVEEGNLPRSAYNNSFIPESLREAFGLTTQKHRIAVYAYYFFRLVSRPEHLTCVYNESAGDGEQHEMSRFLRQMLAETDIPIKTRWLRSEPEVKAEPTLLVEKTEEVMHQLRHRYDQSLEGGEHITLSPSAINTYLACPMQFYLDKVLRIRRDDDPEEGISADIIGTIFHDTADFFYVWLRQRFQTDTITADMLQGASRLLEPMLHTVFDVCWFHPTEDFDRLPAIKQRFPKAEELAKLNTYKGTTLIAHDVILRYLQSLIAYDARHTPFRIIGAEQERTIEVRVKGEERRAEHQSNNGKAESDSDYSLSVRIGGRIDRIDEMNGRLRIVDYKTGTHEQPRYQLQIFTYALVEMEQKESTLPIQPVLFFPIKASAKDYEPSVSVGGNVIDDFATQHAEAFRESLNDIIAEIFNPDKPFTCTTNTKVCEYCKLGLICGK